jgi:hypothetical protein
MPSTAVGRNSNLPIIASIEHVPSRPYSVNDVVPIQTSCSWGNPVIRGTVIEVAGPKDYCLFEMYDQVLHDRFVNQTETR